MGKNKNLIKFFWIFSRLLLIGISFSSLLKISKNSNVFSNVINGSSLVYIILMIIVLIGEVFRNKNKNSLKLFTGTLSLIYGTGISIFLISLLKDYLNTPGKIYSFRAFFIIGFFLCLWIVLFGVVDLKNRK